MTSPRTTVLSVATNRSGAKSPDALVVVLEEEGVDVSSLNSTSATGSYPPSATQGS